MEDIERNVRTPTIRTSTCSGIFQYAVMNSDDRAWSSDRAVRYRCTWLWSHPKYDSIRNKPPMRPDQNV